MRAVGDLKHEENQHHNHSSQRKVDIKAPSPGDVCGEGASDQRAEHRRDAKHRTKETLVFRPLVQRNRVGNDENLSTMM